MILAKKRQQFVQHIHEQLTGKNNKLPEEPLAKLQISRACIC